MRVPPVLVAFVLVVLGGVASSASDAARTTPRATPGAASLLGGFTAIAVQVLWLRADQAVMERREADAQIAFAAINELEPELISSSNFIATALGFNLADGHKDPAVRWALAKEGWRVLSRTIEKSPGEARAYEARGRYALLRLARDNAMRDGFLREVGADGPVERARLDLEEAVRLRQRWLGPWALLALASMQRAEEHFSAGRFPDAAIAFRRAQTCHIHVVDAWREMNESALQPNIEDSTDTAAFAGELAAIAELPPAERASRHEELRRNFPDARLPALPAR